MECATDYKVLVNMVGNFNFLCTLALHFSSEFHHFKTKFRVLAHCAPCSTYRVTWNFTRVLSREQGEWSCNLAQLRMNYFSPFKTIINNSVLISVPMFLPRTIAPIGGGCRRLRRHWTPRYHPGARRDPHGYPRGPWRWIGQWRPAYVSSSFLLQRFKSKPDWRRRTTITVNPTPVKIVKVNIFGHRLQ